MKEATNMLWRSHRNAFMTGVESVKGGGGRVLYPRSGVRWGSGVRVQHPGKNRSPRQSILDFMTVFSLLDRMPITTEENNRRLTNRKETVIGYSTHRTSQLGSASNSKDQELLRGNSMWRTHQLCAWKVYKY